MSTDKERALVLFVVAVVLIATPARALWFHNWWSPFAFWLALIAVILSLHRTDHAA